MEWPVVRGYAAPFGNFGDLDGDDAILIHRDAFGQSPGYSVGLRLWDHRARDVASTGNGTLSLFEDTYGLAFEARLPPCSASWQAVRAIEAGQLRGCSVKIERTVEKCHILDGAKALRSLRYAQISHIALVPRPAFKTTAVWSARVDRGQMPKQLQELAFQWAVSNRTSKQIPGRLARCAAF